MSDLNSLKNRVVWVDIPVANLDRAQKFYAAVLGIAVHKEQFGDVSFCVLDHQDGNGGCLVENAAEVSTKGALVYLNVDKRIQDAVAKVESNGGSIITPIHAIGPHGFRAVIIDSEGNRIALHSTVDS
jgi:predicted enzyme related to lactoylglutathione lyase